MSGPGPAPDGGVWEARGRDAAARIQDVSAALILGTDPTHAAHVAVGIARAERARRRVVLGDLVGSLAPLYELAGGEDAPGLTDCFQDGLPLGDIARPSADDDMLFVLPSGTAAVETEAMLAHERWPRLVGGFAEAGALLLLVARPGAPGLDALVATVGNVIAVELPKKVARRLPVLVSIDAPRDRRRAWSIAGSRRRLAFAAGAAVVCAAAIGGWMAWRRRTASPASSIAAAVHATGAVAPAVAPVASAAAPPARADTVRLAGPVNPGDSVLASAFAVEVMAANTLTGANSVLENAGNSPYPAPTVSPALPGGAGILWYRIMVGAWRERAGADSMLAVLRALNVVRRDGGRVVRVPYALELANGVSRGDAVHMIERWRARRVTAYALVQDDGSVRVFAGAFETPAQAAPLAASVRDAGTIPVVAFRIGRMF